MKIAGRPKSSGAFANMLRDFDSVREFFTSATMTGFVDLPFTLFFLFIIYQLGGGLVFVLIGLIGLVLLAGAILQGPLKHFVRKATRSSEAKHGLLVETISGLETIKAAGADGIGLYRTEFLFMGRETLPDEEEQFEAYRKVIKGMAGKPVTIRTLDIGADKALEGINTRVEPNPALGLRAIRFSLAEPQMFLAQLRALLRASHYGKLKLLVPMLAHAHEIDQTLGLIAQAREQLREKKQKYDEHLEIGGMIEVPAAALALGMFIRRLQFLSIGTNDLIQYTLAIDRTDEAVAHLYDPLHPAVLKLIGGTIQSCARFGLPISVCVELAGDSTYTRLLLGMGLREFSMHPSQILEVKQEILRADVGDIAPKVQRILKMDEPARIREAMERL